MAVRIGAILQERTDVEVDTSPVASGTDFRICPLCEESKLVFSGLNEARCPACDYQPSGGLLETLRQILALPEASKTSHGYPNENSEPEGRAS